MEEWERKHYIKIKSDIDSCLRRTNDRLRLCQNWFLIYYLQQINKFHNLLEKFCRTTTVKKHSFALYIRYFNWIFQLISRKVAFHLESELIIKNLKKRKEVLTKLPTSLDAADNRTHNIDNKSLSINIASETLHAVYKINNTNILVLRTQKLSTKRKREFLPFKKMNLL